MLTYKIVFIVLAAYVIGGGSTADILRLTRGIVPKQLDGECVCSICGKIISPQNQIPIYSYIKNKGKCTNCNMPIPRISFILEIVIPCVIMIIAFKTFFSASTFTFAFIFYQLIKIAVILIYGRQENSFIKRNVVSLLYNFAIFVSCYLIIYLIEFVGFFL